jgi:hypothetical protein
MFTFQKVRLTGSKQALIARNLSEAAFGQIIGNPVIQRAITHGN